MASYNSNQTFSGVSSGVSGGGMVAPKPPAEVRFAENIEDLTKLLHGIIADLYQKKLCTIDPTMINIAAGFISGLDPNVIITNFIYYSKDFWGQISERDEVFFAENCKHVFRDLPISSPGTHIDAFKDLYEGRYKEDISGQKIRLNIGDEGYDEGKNILSLDEKESLWVYFETLVVIAIKYIHSKRKPKIKVNDEDGKERLVYTAEAFTDVKKIPKWARTFGVELEWKS